MSDALPVVAAFLLAAALLVVLASIFAAPGRPKNTSVLTVAFASISRPLRLVLVLALSAASLTLNLVHVLWFSPSIGYMLYLLIPALVLTLGSLSAIIIHSQRKSHNP